MRFAHAAGLTDKGRLSDRLHGMPYHQLDADRILPTLDRLQRRIEERFQIGRAHV